MEFSTQACAKARQDEIVRSRAQVLAADARGLVRDERVVFDLVANGATIPPDGADADDAYLCKVRAAGGFPAYEKAHRTRLTATCARVVFPRLPVDVVSHVVAFAFHTGYY